MSSEQDTSTETPLARSKKWPRVAFISGILCILAAGALGFGAQMSLMDPYSFNYRHVELVWTHSARLFGLLAVAASAGALVSIGVTSPRLRSWSLRLLSLTTVAVSILCLLGFAWANEAEDRGGDWVGLDIIVAILFGILFPGFIAIFSGLQFVALRRMGRRPPA